MIPSQQKLLCLFSVLFSSATAFVPLSSRQQSRKQQLCPLSLAAGNSPIIIALTREEGKNGKLRKQLTEQLEADNTLDQVDIMEIPCIAHADGPDLDKLGETLTDQAWDYVAVTSPEAARVLATVWKEDAFVSHPPPAVAVVGKATQAALEKAGIPVAFCPSKATAKVLVKELPVTSEESTALLYPASAKAAQTLQSGLTERGFAVTRLDTYDTVTATWTSEEQQTAANTQIVCVASPSSIKGWLANTNENSDDKPPFLAACIGETSAQACRELGFDEEQIFYPEKPGIPGWVGSIQEALKALSSADHPVATSK